ncbi:DUF2783 domain-containing protein [Sulfitobacter sp. SK012]|uniref:DUF2783 domain-containing protein n=1 Tax=Sulfitobacter sp. SK012 TaxID=1389005 RepID=UPI000E0ADDE9|nr:DUF2783 domain-containing protein [Sulfitobacter sp. SK012]AXI47631.1 DUF2783 domain-containing protein [Sulfitobacter sp. SK012]
MSPTDVERVYDALAEALDMVGAEKSKLFLAKLALLLPKELDDVERVLSLINMASINLDASN